MIFKKLLLLLFFLTATISVYAQENNWTNLEENSRKIIQPISMPEWVEEGDTLIINNEWQTEKDIVNYNNVKKKTQSISDIMNYDTYKNRKWKKLEYFTPPSFVNMEVYNKMNPKTIYLTTEGKMINNKWEEVDSEWNVIIPPFNTNFYSISFSTPKELPFAAKDKELFLKVDWEFYKFGQLLWFEGKEHDIEIYYEENSNKKYIINGKYDISKIIEMDLFYQQNLFTAEVENKMTEEEKANIYDKKEDKNNTDFILKLLANLAIILFVIWLLIFFLNKWKKEKRN